MEDFLTISQAAKLLGVSRQRVHQMLQDGQFNAVRNGHRWCIPVDDVYAVRLNSIERIAAKAATLGVEVK